MERGKRSSRVAALVFCGASLFVHASTDRLTFFVCRAPARISGRRTKFSSKRHISLVSTQVSTFYSASYHVNTTANRTESNALYTSIASIYAACTLKYAFFPRIRRSSSTFSRLRQTASATAVTVVDAESPEQRGRRREREADAVGITALVTCPGAYLAAQMAARVVDRDVEQAWLRRAGPFCRREPLHGS